MRLLRTRYQKVEHLEFTPAGGLLACGLRETVYWPTPLADAAGTKLGSGRAAVLAGGTHIGFRDHTGVYLFPLPDGGLRPFPSGEGRVDVVVSLSDAVFALYGLFASLRGMQLIEGKVRTRWAVTPPSYGSRPVRLSDAEFAQFHWGGRVVTRATDSGQEVRAIQLATSTHAFTVAAASPDGRLLALTSDNQVRVYDPTPPAFAPVRRIDNADGRHFTGVAFHPTGRFLAATSNDTTVKLYDTANWAVAAAFSWEVGKMRSVAFSPDGTLAAAGSDTGRVVVWDVDV